MRTNPPTAGTAIAIVSLFVSLYILQNDNSPRPVETMRPTSGLTSPQNKTSTPTDTERRTELTSVEQQQFTLMSDRIATLEARIRHMETTANQHVQNQIASIPNEPEPNKANEKAKPKRLSEGDFGSWMDKTLDAGDFDRDTTKEITEQMVANLTEVPGVNLADLQCGERFCRASFVSNDGKTPNVSQLIGASSFIDSGFTVNEPDGRVKVYFTQPGQSLSDLRSEAQESAPSDMPLS